jgi:hypothetical protein
MLRIDPPQQLAFVEPEGERVIRLLRPGLPPRLLTRQDDRQTIEVGDDTPIDRLIDGEQPGLVCEQLSDGDALFALLRDSGQYDATRSS